MTKHQALLRRADRWQRQRPAVAVPLAVVKRFGEDGAGHLAALIAYYGFLSLFPLLLVLVTVLGLVLQNDPGLRARIVDSALAQFPIVGAQIRRNLGVLSGSGVALTVGIAGALWAGLGGLRAAQSAMDAVWDVPYRRRPRFPVAILRSAMMLGSLGLFLLLSSLLAGVAGGTDVPVVWIGATLAAAILNVALFATAFKVLTVADVGWRDVFPGAAAAGIAWTLLLLIGGWIVETRLRQASEVYGFFGIVIGLMAWIYFGAQMTLLAAETNVVIARRLWPRALDPDDRTEADERALLRLAKVEERRKEEKVSVRFDDEAHQPGPDAAGSTSTRSSEDERSGSPPWAARPALPARRSLGKLVGSVVNGVVSLFRKEIELAKMELVASISARAKGTGMFAAAVVLTLFAVGFLAASASTALAIVVPTWTANAIVGVVFLVIAVVVVPIARRQMRTPPIAPEQTRRTLKEEVEWAKQQIRR